MKALDAILKQKRKEIAQQRNCGSAQDFMNHACHDVRDFAFALQKPGMSIIAELKRKSPSAGLITRDCDPARIIKEYVRGGARAISVLTDKKFFGGNPEDVLRAKHEAGLPILRKEFILHEHQIHESKVIGADAILLIASIITTDQLNSFIGLASTLGMACLVEVHSAEELRKVLSTPAHIIGVNNRDLNTLEVHPERALQLRPMIPDGYVTVAESGIKTRTDVLALERAGYDAVLVGESLMKSKNPSILLTELLGGKRYGYQDA